tara:strand:+ start:275 stop:574 length:300 start_codon:yes stop_codon:yes gene_type:complete
MSKKDLSVLKPKKSNPNKREFLIYPNFKLYLNKFIKSKNILVAVSGGSDSLALAALSKIYSNEYKKKTFFFALVDHGMRANSSQEAVDIKSLLKKKKLI